MSKLSEIISEKRNGVLALRFYKDGRLISSGSGFLYKGYIVSNNHVFNPFGSPMAASITVGCRFGDTNQYGSDDFTIGYANLELVTGSDVSSHDYAVYKLPDGVDITDRFQFSLDHSSAYEGQQVLILGYPFSSEFMSSHVGYISAIHEKAGVKIYQLDASVNSGNSGGPLIDVDTGNVLGIVTRKATGLSEQFDELIKSFDGNIKVLEEHKGVLGLGGIDPIQIMQAGQEQMKVISDNIKKSANVGIGQAFSTQLLEQEDLD